MLSLRNVEGGWMQYEYGTLVEFLWEGGKPNYSEKILFQCRFVHRKSNTEWPAIEPPSLRKDVKD